jgi:S1-C subfamily serine protease
MNGRHQIARTWIAVLLPLLLVGSTGPRAVGQNQAESLSASFRKAAERARASVVTVRPADGFGVWTPNGSTVIQPPVPVSPMPRVRVRNLELGREAGGSGIVVDADRGYILTLDQLLDGASQATVVLGDGRERNSSQIRRDPQSDLAIVAIDPKGSNLTSVRWGDSRSLQAGDWVLTVGQPAGLEPSLSAGIFSARRFGSGSAPAGELLETDAAVNTTNSGGPLLNLNGEVVGINAFAPSQRGHAGMGYAIAGDRARRIAADLIEIGRARRAHLGMHIEPGGRAAADRGLSPGTVAISSVSPGSPADQGGLRPGDLIVTVAGRPVAGIEMLQSAVEFAPLGEDLALGIERDGRRQDIKVRPAASPDRGGFGIEIQPPAGSRRDALRVRPRPSTKAAPRENAPGQPNPKNLEPAPPPEPAPPGQRPAEAPASDRSNQPPK